MIVDILGTLWRVLRSPLKDGVEGECRHQKREIHISRKTAASGEWEVLSHEIFHACELTTDTERRLRDELKLGDEAIEHIREVYAGTVIPVFLDTLERNGWLTRPGGDR